MAGFGVGFLTMNIGSPKNMQPPPQQGDILLVIHDFNARTTDELTLRKSDRVELIELDEGFGDGWYLGRHLTRGDTGLFPGVYTTKAPPTSGRPGLSQLVSRNSFSSRKSSYNTPLSPVPSSPADYRTNESPVDQSMRASSQYSPAFGYDSPRSSLPASYNPHAPGIPRSIGQTMGHNNDSEDSTVMNETLNVIDEHITDLSTPRQSTLSPPTIPEDSESDYSSRLDQQSYIAGPETDDEGNEGPTEAEVRKWDHKQAAEHLRSIGVDAHHCNIFEEQEIPGEVLLDMDQGFIYMKEYDFGVMGRRLKTWHKIRDFQNEVKQGKISRQTTLPSIDGSSIEESGRAQGRLVSTGSLLPRIPSLQEKPGLNIRQSHQSNTSQEGGNTNINNMPTHSGYPRPNFGGQTPPSPWRASMAPEGYNRPSAAMVRELNHSRRHSSIDTGKQPDSRTPISSPIVSNASHQKQPSLDRNWSMSASTLGMTASPTTTTTGTPREPSYKSPTMTIDTPPVVTNLDPELDRGYFSGNELENRKQRNVLRKRDSGSASAMHSRQSSANNMPLKRHSRLVSADSIRDIGSQSPAAKAYHAGGMKARFRSSSAQSSISKIQGIEDPPAVTNLEKPSPSPRVVSTPSQPKTSLQNKAKKLIGLRAASEATPNSDKSITTQGNQAEGSTRTSPIASPTGSTTPSATSRSLDYEASDIPSKLHDIPGMTLPKAQPRNKPKAKQETSAYQRGLLKITPEEARQMCDYHGWMKKKSSSLITTWKPRLFILRGRRLSYYYAETDTEERGIIDISGHKVLAANSDAMVTLHAQITGATSTASPASMSSSAEPSPTLTKSPEPGSTLSPFYFKLVPPKSGMSRAVQFTKPTIHFFQVDSIDTGRRWMGEIMKATIEHDLSSFETTNKQKTISLAKARARRERPPALKEDEPLEIEGDGEQEVGNNNMTESGLNIQGLDFSNPPVSLEPLNEQAKDESTVQSNSDTNPAAAVPSVAAQSA